MQILRMMRMQRVAGLILISTRSSARHGARLMAEINVPTVLMGSHVAGTPFDTVTLDEVAAGRLATGRLLDLGHRRVSVVAGRIGVSSNDERVKGCQAAFAERGLALKPENVIIANFKEEQAFAETRRLLSQAQRPTAIVSLSNMMTIGVMRALVAEQVASPRDISLIGIDDFDWAEIMNPKPTTIAQPIVEMTREAISILLDQIGTGRPSTGRRVMFEPRFVGRESCAALIPGVTAK
jgi:DNA-binding LacI/PurR family transcriptional regulator